MHDLADPAASGGVDEKLKVGRVAMTRALNQGAELGRLEAQIADLIRRSPAGVEFSVDVAYGSGNLATKFTYSAIARNADGSVFEAITATLAN